MSAVIETRQELRIVHVFGAPFERGLQHGQALRDDIQGSFQQVWRDRLFRLSPFLGASVFRAWARMQARFLDADERDELRGVAQGSGLDLDDVLIMNSAPPFEAAHNLLSGGQTTACTQIAVRAPAGVILGRNLDALDLSPGFVILVNHPDRGSAWLTPGYAGKVLDAITGWNANGLVVSQDTAELPYEHVRGLYTGALVRRIAQRCATLADAERLVRNTRALCGGGRNILVADPREAAVLEIAQRLFGRPHIARRSWGECGDPPNAIVVANHFRTPELDLIAPSPSSAARARRATALVRRGIPDAQAMKTAMTDKVDPRSGLEAPSDCTISWYGPRIAGLPPDLDMRIATRVSTVADLGARRLWVAGGRARICDPSDYVCLEPATLFARPGEETGDRGQNPTSPSQRDEETAVATKTTETTASATRLANVREEMRRMGVDGFIVPRADEHQGEYVPAHAARLAWATGFTGSAGVAVILAERAVVFVDGRYTLQVRQQVDNALFEFEHLTLTPPSAWLSQNAKKGMRIGFDPWLHTRDGVAELLAALEGAGAEAVALDRNPVDAAWSDQPAPPLTPVIVHDVKHAGRSSQEKRKDIAADLRASHLDAAVLSAPDAIAWLLNVRATDVERTPVTLSFAIIDREGGVQWFIDERKLSDEVRKHVGDVRIAGRDALLPALDALAGKRVRIDSATAAWAISDRLTKAGAKVLAGLDPCALPKACKNAVELEGMREAHRRDAVAMCRFLAWVTKEAMSGQLGEIAASDKLEAFRRELPEFRDLSFDSISGAGANGAIVHYHSTPATERKLTPGELYLIDSGGQYPDGTTDITRTLAIGTPPREAAEHFTLVLKGHIALGQAIFPNGTGGIQLDAFARRALWERGLDYDHGTGHGVGSYLAVHEGPHRIAKQHNSVALQPGMIASNEPGYYKTGAYGIRIENLVAVKTVEVDGTQMLAFETLTLVPIDRALVVADMLTESERAWLNAYHARVREEIGPRLDPDTCAWLEQATAPI